MRRELNYSDVSLVPGRCVVKSRSECNTSVEFGGLRFEMPIYPANMPSVVDVSTCVYFARNDWFYTMHRFGIDNVEFTNIMHGQGLFSSISIGLADEEEIGALQEVDPEYVTIDVANAWSESIGEVIENVKRALPASFLIVGNVAAAEAINELQDLGADAIKIGIAQGHACTTRYKTGFGRPMISTILECAEIAKVPLIADGGIEHPGDMAKALTAGATMVMAGKLFAGYHESAGGILETPAGSFKEYYGNASEFNKTEYKNIEGTKILVDYKDSIAYFMKELKEDLQSSISYAGGRDLSALRNVEMIQVAG